VYWCFKNIFYRYVDKNGWHKLAAVLIGESLQNSENGKIAHNYDQNYALV